ncbi:deoxyribose-phosphate aldolase [Pseudoalteromonas citrea]|uniref:Deoxyribose-phosphate aldolase n=2 Tax=Pseudoalteromonas citrea TaxID=43655 RepID=A0AAD4AGC5_9GAMM|nr:deoxyribose-phosphate aldolase [Pseudoalteromonas citrea]KAF7767648.1 deoxyribose-phosphate aldolase [Pseudoalteromonas citrea]
MTEYALAQRVLTLMDLTSLNDDDSVQQITDLIDGIDQHHALPAAICVFPQFVAHGKQRLLARELQQINVATVTNFPQGEQSIDGVLQETERALTEGADEIDLVLPYKQLLAGDPDTAWQYVHSTKQLCRNKSVLKVIIESGQLEDPVLIEQATEIAVLAGADFVKTSTGKVPVNATLDAARVILQTIKKTGKDVGFKAAGGVKTVEEAQQYIYLAEDIMGASWVNSQHFRFGASSLLSDVYRILNKG